MLYHRGDRSSPAQCNTPGLSLEQLSAGYGKQVMVDNISLTIPPGRMTVLAGANGSGKSTLLGAIARLLPPLGGSVLLDGAQIHRLSTKAVARRLGILPQNPAIPAGLTVFDLVSRGRFPHQRLLRQWSVEDQCAVENAMALTGTLEFAQRQMDSLSGGQRQRCWIAMALAQETEIILLDEPTSFLDLRYQIDILELLSDLTRHHQRTVVVVLHDLNLALNYGDSVVFMKQGKIRGVLADPRQCDSTLVKAVFDVEMQMMINPATQKPCFMPLPVRSRVEP